jgi:hypothetical protein
MILKFNNGNALIPTRKCRKKREVAIVATSLYIITAFGGTTI